MESNCFEKKSFGLFEPCIYSDKLLSKIFSKNIDSANKVDELIVRKAIFYAKKYHGNQLRESGEPYYSHPLEVAYMVCEYLFRTDIIVTSILHDTIEDTDLTAKMIEAAFGKQIATQVEDLTRIKKNGTKISAAEMIDSLWSEKKYDLLMIKQFDRLHNMMTLLSKSPEKQQKIALETIENFIVLAAYLGLRELEEELVNICSKFLNERQLIDDDLALPFGNDKDFLSLLFQNDVCHK